MICSCYNRNTKLLEWPVWLQFIFPPFTCCWICISCDGISMDGTCHSILRTLGFRLIFAVIYVLLSTSLLTGFLIKNPKSLHRMLKITGNYFLGIFLYTLVIILLADFGRILLKYVFHASWIHSRTLLQLPVQSVHCWSFS